MRLIICFFLRFFLEVPLGNTRHTMGRKKRGSNTGSPMTTPFFEHGENDEEAATSFNPAGSARNQRDLVGGNKNKI